LGWNWEGVGGGEGAGEEGRAGEIDTRPLPDAG
jgi:hypothetical protein